MTFDAFLAYRPIDIHLDEFQRYFCFRKSAHAAARDAARTESENAVAADDWIAARCGRASEPAKFRLSWMKSVLNTRTTWPQAAALRQIRLLLPKPRVLPVARPAFLTYKRPLNINIRRPQRIGLNKVPARLHLIPHQHREHTIGLDRIIDLHA